MNQNKEEIISRVTDEIAASCNPVKIILVSNKYNTKKDLVSFKICVIVKDIPSTAELEGELYMKTDCEIPFDILIYNLSEWESLICEDDTFAAKINHTGVVLYEQE